MAGGVATVMVARRPRSPKQRPDIGPQSIRHHCALVLARPWRLAVVGAESHRDRRRVKPRKRGCFTDVPPLAGDAPPVAVNGRVMAGSTLPAGVPTVGLTTAGAESTHPSGTEALTRGMEWTPSTLMSGMVENGQ